MVDLDNEFYLVKFSNMEDREFVLTGGPCKILDHYLTIKEWVSNFNFTKAQIDFVATWVRFPKLPMEYYG